MAKASRNRGPEQHLNAAFLKKLRKQHNLSQEQLAGDARLSRGTIQAVERGLSCSFATAKVLADFFKVPLKDLLRPEGAGEPNDRAGPQAIGASLPQDLGELLHALVTDGINPTRRVCTVSDGWRIALSDLSHSRLSLPPQMSEVWVADTGKSEEHVGRLRPWSSSG